MHDRDLKLVINDFSERTVMWDMAGKKPQDAAIGCLTDTEDWQLNLCVLSELKVRGSLF